MYSDNPDDDKRQIHMERYLNSHADDLLHDFLHDDDKKDVIENIITASPAYDEFLMQTPFDVTGTVILFMQTHPKDAESIIELSEEYTSYCDRRATMNWIEYCEYKRGMSCREEV